MEIPLCNPFGGNVLWLFGLRLIQASSNFCHKNNSLYSLNSWGSQVSNLSVSLRTHCAMVHANVGLCRASPMWLPL